jgi:hypothetical protein
MELEIFFDSLCVAFLPKAKGRSSEQYLEIYFILHRYIYSRTSNNGHCRGIQILSVIGGVR